MSEFPYEMLESLPYGLGIVDRQGRFVLCNAALAASYRGDAQSLLGMCRDDAIAQMLCGPRSSFFGLS